MYTLVKLYFALILILIIISCQKPKEELLFLQDLNDSIKKVHAPDKRVAIYDISIASRNGVLQIIGESDQIQAVNDLLGIIESKGIPYENQSQMLPDESIGNTTYAIVTNSVANIRSKPKHSGELSTQALLGTVVKVLKITGDFYLIQTPDGYISWVDHGGVILMNDEQYTAWINTPKIVFTAALGYVYQNTTDERQKVGDIVLGAQLNFLEETDNFFKVQYPDKRKGYIKKSEGEHYKSWLNELQSSGTLIELYAKELLGTPYLWGGTSVKGMDCSGFTKTVYLMNGYIIPRDASQQIMAGKDNDPEMNFKHMQKGDLMFFGRKATDSNSRKVTHVGIWLGNDQGEFIHSSGRVKLGSIDPESPYYDEHNKNRYLGSRRYLGESDRLIQNLKNELIDERIKS